jgi:hypothetical protein
MPKWLALTMLSFFLALAGAMVWMGMAIVVRCDRVHEDRVDVTVERRILGLIPLSREVVPDVTDAGIVVSSRKARSKGGRGATVKLSLTPRQGDVVVRNRFGPSFGTQPSEMAAQIDQFIKAPSRTSLTTWWMPWLVNVFAVPFGLLPGAALGEVLLRKLGFIKPEPNPGRANR